MELTSGQKHDISLELNASDLYETVPFLNHVLKVLGYSDYIEDDREREELRWTKRVEPLIKDEKIRKAVRAWAEANNLSGASTYKSCSYSHYWYIRAFDDTEKGIDIDIGGELPKELIDCKYYTIAELCGEEEE